MNNLNKLMVIALCIFTSCSSKYTSPITEWSEEKESPYFIEKWKIVGPFVKDSSVISYETNIDYDFLREGEYSETNLSPEYLFSRSLHSILQPKEGINFYKYYDKNELSKSIYLYTYISCNSDEDNTFLLFTGLHESKVFINNEFVYKSDCKMEKQKFYEEYIPIKLKKGKNLLLIKISTNKSTSNWLFKAVLSNQDYAYKNFLTDYRFDFLYNSIIDPSDSIKVYLGPFINSDRVRIVSEGHKNINTIYVRDTLRGRLSIINSTNEVGMHNYQMQIDKDTISQLLYIGNIDSCIKNYDNVISSLSGIKEYQKNNLLAMQNIIRHCLMVYQKSISLSIDQGEDERSIAFYTNEMSKLLNSINLDNNYSTKGFVREYRSSVDNSQHYYFFHNSNKHKNLPAGTPLMIFLPMNYFGSSQYFLKNWLIRNFDQILGDIALCEEYGFTYVLPSLRGSAYDSPIVASSIFDVINDIEKEIKIDRDNIFLLSNCSSTRQSVTFATRYSNLFAGIALVNPITNIPDNYYLQNLLNSKISMISSKDDEVTPIADVINLKKQFQKYSNNVSLKVIEDATHYIVPKDLYRSVIEYMSKKSGQKSDTIHIATKELKYGTYKYMKICGIKDRKLALLSASFNNNELNITTQNVDSLEIDTRLLNINSSLSLKISINDSLFDRTINRKDSTIGISLGVPRSGLLKNAYVEGPISHVFTSKFRVVTTEHSNNRPLSKAFQEMWMKANVCEIASESIRNIDLNRYSDCNLVLLSGKDKFQDLQQRFKFPVEVTDEYISLLGEKYYGKDLTLQMVWPNPMNSEKYVLLILHNSSSKNSKFTLDDFTLINDDYVIISNGNDEQQIMGSGNFNRLWK